MFWMCIRIASVRQFYYTSETYDFMEKYEKLSIFIILIPTPDFPHFYYMLGGNLGSLLYGDVSVINNSLSKDQEEPTTTPIRNKTINIRIIRFVFPTRDYNFIYSS